jgi:hypothetical protein
MRRGRVSIGLEISGREAHLALLERAPGARPRLLAAKSFSLAAPKDDAESISRAIRDVGGAGNDCFLAWLPDGEPITHQLVTAPAMRTSEQLGYLKRLSDKKAGAAAGSDLHWQLQPLGSARIGDHPGVELLAVRLGREQLTELVYLARALPVRLRLATTVPLGLARVEALLRTGPGEEGRPPLALASLSIGRVTLTIVEEGQVRLVREFNPSLLVESSADPTAPVRLAEELARTVRYFEQTNHPATVARLVLGGDPELLERSIAPLRELVRCPVLALAPLLRAALDIAPGTEGERNVSPVALGMALGRSGPRVPNLLPPREQFRRERRLIAAVAALAVIAAGTAAWPARERTLAAAGTAEEQVAKIEGVHRSRAERRFAADALRRDLEWAERWRTLFERLAENQDRWARLAVGLANVVPPSLVFSSLEATRHGEGYRLSIESQLNANDAAVLEGSVRGFATQVRALAHVKELVMAPLDLRAEMAGRSGPQQKIEFDFDNPSPFRASALPVPARRADRDEDVRER